MIVAVWGAGNLGTALVRRVSTTSWVSEIRWINRTVSDLAAHAIDIQHSLALAPCCHRVETFPQTGGASARWIDAVDVIIVTAGTPVPMGEANRDLVLGPNRAMMLHAIAPVLRGFGGIVVVVTNPVDAMTTVLQRATGLPPERVIGLGTLVETARLKAALAGHLRPSCAAREIDAHAIGTHDADFVPVVSFTVAPRYDQQHLDDIIELARREVVHAAGRVKDAGGRTQHPIVEGIVHLLDALNADRRELLTVSTVDSSYDPPLAYSVPCEIRRTGAFRRYDKVSTRHIERLAPSLARLARQLTNPTPGDPA